ncbi:MAG: hypothetical protein RR060_07795, partial [Victivallaceae bacterium]
NNETCAGEAFGYKQLFHEPIMGGGLWTATALALIFSNGAGLVWLLSMVGLVLWLIIFWFYRRRQLREIKKY